MKNIPKWAWIIVVGLALAAVFFLRNGGDSNTSAAYQIETAALDRGDIVRSVASSGAVRPLITVEVGSQLSGQVAEIHADFNTPVEEGQIYELAFDGSDADAERLERATGLGFLGDATEPYPEPRPCHATGAPTTRRVLLSRSY